MLVASPAAVRSGNRAALAYAEAVESAAILTEYRGLSVGQLAQLRRQLREAGGDLAIACTREQHLKLFTITGFGEGVSIAPTVEEAAKGFRPGS